MSSCHRINRGVPEGCVQICKISPPLSSEETVVGEGMRKAFQDCHRIVSIWGRYKLRFFSFLLQAEERMWYMLGHGCIGDSQQWVSAHCLLIRLFWWRLALKRKVLSQGGHKEVAELISGRCCRGQKYRKNKDKEKRTRPAADIERNGVNTFIFFQLQKSLDSTAGVAH